MDHFLSINAAIINEKKINVLYSLRNSNLVKDLNQKSFSNCILLIFMIKIHKKIDLMDIQKLFEHFNFFDSFFYQKRIMKSFQDLNFIIKLMFYSHK